eukprot:gnl/MRDRNA2_/MRDRNA2_193155_c0_seq1.p1 gnl/MRDRNA2_/MRDRNA2_193155_c0~~gnl/MRDRNA2_/MRDRNA2_193155_c0_seq1.p1  ORF type:complete len:215 (-),score=32.34 gnl/MRDRNA2_/MRDRNA2_193155_c0_seq1:49-693(-)
MVAEVMWTQNIEGLIHGGSSESPQMPHSPESVWSEGSLEMVSTNDVWIHVEHERSCEYGDTIFLVKLTRCGEVRDALHRGMELEPVRAAAHEAGYICQMMSGVSMFLYPQQYASIISVLPDHGLRPHHVVIAEPFLPLLYQEIVNLPSKKRVQPSSANPLALVEGDNATTICLLQRTFYNTVPSRFRSADSVTQSTSAARHVSNPRRSMPAEHF